MSLQERRKSNINHWLPVGLWLVLFIAIAAATLKISPSWGLMDDFGLLTMAQEFWGPPINTHAVTQNFITSGMLRPFYYSWAAIFYEIFRHWPAGFYVGVALFNMTAMIFWGMVFYRLFAVRREDRYWVVFFYPLTFFLFLPFWNIFNYLSLQEKFVVFFAPLVIYFFHRVYLSFNRRDCILMYVCLLFGLMSKATFIYVLFILFLYPVLDLIFFRYRPEISKVFVWINGLIFSSYAAFTLFFQLKGNYTAKYKSGLAGTSMIGKVLGLPLVMKCLMVVGVVGFLAIVGYVIFRRRPQVSMAVVIYAGLIGYIVLLMPWGFQSYLISAIGPLALGAVSPVYAWFIVKNKVLKICLNTVIVSLLAVVFVGNIVPNIQRMRDIAGAIAFIKTNSASAEDIYFMPSGYEESAYATGKFTQKRVHYCSEGKITREMLSPSARNYVVFTNLFSSIVLSGVSAGKVVYENSTWKIIEIYSSEITQDETVKVEFPKTIIHQIKALIREL